MPDDSIERESARHRFAIGDEVICTWASIRKDVAKVQNLPILGGTLYIIRWPDNSVLCVSGDDLRPAHSSEPPVSDARLEELISLKGYHSTRMDSDELDSVFRELRQLRALAQTQRLGPMEG